jgi:hypothetical protein
VTSSVSGNSKVSVTVGLSRTEGPPSGRYSEWVALSLGPSEHVGSHFRLPQRLARREPVLYAKIIEDCPELDVGLIFAHGTELAGRVPSRGVVVPPNVGFSLHICRSVGH